MVEVRARVEHEVWEAKASSKLRGRAQSHRGHYIERELKSADSQCCPLSVKVSLTSSSELRYARWIGASSRGVRLRMKAPPWSTPMNNAADGCLVEVVVCVCGVVCVGGCVRVCRLRATGVVSGGRDKVW